MSSNSKNNKSQDKAELSKFFRGMETISTALFFIGVLVVISLFLYLVFVYGS